MVIRVMFVEDDEHKISDLIQYWRKWIGRSSYIVKKSVREAVVAVHDHDYDLMVLDMALPTFDQSAKTSGGTSQIQGGLEIIRTLKVLGKTPPIVIFTQYDGLELDGKYIPMSDAVRQLRDRYNCDVVGAVLYEYQSDDWKEEFDRILTSQKWVQMKTTGARH